jgi:hypothetical protein
MDKARGAVEIREYWQYEKQMEALITETPRAKSTNHIFFYRG